MTEGPAHGEPDRARQGGGEKEGDVRRSGMGRDRPPRRRWRQHILHPPGGRRRRIPHLEVVPLPRQARHALLTGWLIGRGGTRHAVASWTRTRYLQAETESSAPSVRIV